MAIRSLPKKERTKQYFPLDNYAIDKANLIYIIWTKQRNYKTVQNNIILSKIYIKIF